MAMAELDPFPVAIAPSGEKTVQGLVSFIQKNKPKLEESLANSGAILFRGFTVSSPEEFAQVVEAFGYKSMGYEAGAANRTYLVGPVFTANELPLHLPIGFHNEMGYLPNYPDVVMFFCETAPPEGGETGIVQGRAVYEHMLKEYPDFMRDLEAKKLVYYNILDESELMSSLGTSDKEATELKASKLSKSLQWLEDGRVKVFHGPLPGVRNVDDNRKTWFNNIGTSSPSIPNLRHLEFGDRTPLPAEAVRESLEFMRKSQVAHKWQTGDVMVVNNHKVLHSRHPSKPPRRILVSMLQVS